MVRRPSFGDEPTSRLSVWSTRFAWFALVVTVMSVIILRSGLLEVTPALATFGAALVCAAVAILLAFASFVVIWRQGLAGLGRSLLGLVLGIALLAYPAFLGYRATRVPRINDITTDTTNPPRFDVLARLRPRGTSDYPGERFAAPQRAAYPDIVPLQLDAPPKLVYDIALSLANKRKWRVVDSRPPGAGRRDGVIEAVARTPIMGFRDDVVIRVNPVGAGSSVDMRSASRIGGTDIGTNAARIRTFLDVVDDAVTAAPEPRVPEPDKKPPAKGTPEKRQPGRR